MAAKIVVVAIAVMVCMVSGKDYCMPHQSCWPNAETIEKFDNSFTTKANVLTPDLGPWFWLACTMKNTYQQRKPGMVVTARTTEDVQKAVLFANEHNIRITVASSGHCYVGRPAEDGSLLINLGAMIAMEIKTNVPTLSDTGAIAIVQPAVTNAVIHNSVSAAGYLAPAGSCPTVAMGGFLIGGGHSPNTRSLGLGADNLIAATMVLADGAIAELSESGTVTTDRDGQVRSTPDADLFWAIRGGGGAFGVVTQYTVKLHEANPGFTSLICAYPFNSVVGSDIYAEDILTHYFLNTLPIMDNYWSGYLLISTGIPNPQGSRTPGKVVFALLHNGKADEAARAQVQPLVDYRPDWTTGKECSFKDYANFWEYQQYVNDPTGFPIAIDNRLQQPEFLTREFAAEMTRLMYDAAGRGDEYVVVSCTAAHVGGMTSVGRNETAVSDYLHDAVFSSTCGALMNKNYGEDRILRFFSDEWYPMMKKYGRGVYYNEPGFDIPDYAEEFWGPKYDRLLEIKKKYDPNNAFNCNQCVGWEKVTNGSGYRFSYTKNVIFLLAFVAALVV
ncbi:PREDICTED: uncharacterized FAD-linked oxidoreductase YvdP-like [Priapulus caudatus]|uniref:Uncharacterized FAD-linked oxidoreductase YvdP-like n=1 Tax=Priapulus caudatus TaxID=37621 RepID=A0ABM1E714_PRICU|nr:PREDICTED: uncharacterized FAD-linked oxidoreductase YvdP-like [Priapulus caudatus]